MLKAFKKKNIIGILIIFYIVALPLILYFSGIFNPTEPPDLKRLTGHMTDYTIKQDFDHNDIFSVTGLNIEHFNEYGYIQSDIRVLAYSNEPDKISYIVINFVFDEIHYIKLTIYIHEHSFNFESFLQYKRVEMYNNTIGIFENTTHDKYIARYRDSTGCVYYIEPLLGFNDIENEFISCLLLMLQC